MDISFTLDDERIEELERLAALGYSPEAMALYFDVDKIFFVQAALNVESKIYYHIQRGKLRSIAQEQLNLLIAAEGGNVTASQQLTKIRRDRGWEVSKTDIFGGFEDKRLLENLTEYIESGSINKLSVEEAIYIEALTLFNSMSRRYGRRKTISFFCKEPFGLKYARATEMYDEAINLFNADRNIEKKALRHRFAEQLEEAAIFVRDNANTSKDWEVFGNLMTQSAKLLGLDKEDPEKLPRQIYDKPIRYYSLKSSDVGLPDVDRMALAQQIEALEIPERDKIRLRQDARLEYVNLEERLHELEEESKSQE
jgi:hypothetical protein